MAKKKNKIKRARGMLGGLIGGQTAATTIKNMGAYWVVRKAASPLTRSLGVYSPPANKLLTGAALKGLKQSGGSGFLQVGIAELGANLIETTIAPSNGGGIFNIFSGIGAGRTTASPRLGINTRVQGS